MTSHDSLIVPVRWKFSGWFVRTARGTRNALAYFQAVKFGFVGHFYAEAKGPWIGERMNNSDGAVEGRRTRGS